MVRDWPRHFLYSIHFAWASVRYFVCRRTRRSNHIESIPRARFAWLNLASISPPYTRSLGSRWRSLAALTDDDLLLHGPINRLACIAGGSHWRRPHFMTISTPVFHVCIHCFLFGTVTMSRCSFLSCVCGWSLQIVSPLSIYPPGPPSSRPFFVPRNPNPQVSPTNKHPTFDTHHHSIDQCARAFHVQKSPIKMATTLDPCASFLGNVGLSSALPTFTVPSPIRLVAVLMDTTVPMP